MSTAPPKTAVKTAYHVLRRRDASTYIPGAEVDVTSFSTREEKLREKLADERKQRHMATKHPDYATTEVTELTQAGRSALQLTT